MSLSKEPAYSELKNHFVCGYRNIMGEPYAGNSGTHGMRGNAVDTTNGAGPHNIQMFLMNADGTVVHCLPGYWNPTDLAHELQFAGKLNRVYANGSMSQGNKASVFQNMQLSHARNHSPDMVARSRMQGFDMKYEAKRLNSDAVKNPEMLKDGWGYGVESAFKTTDVLMHERMAKRPFIGYYKFDVAKFADYGTHTYDKHEDSLDESGRMVSEQKVQWIKASYNKQQRQQRKRKKDRPVGAYVKTYGAVKCDSDSSCQTGK